MAPGGSPALSVAHRWVIGTQAIVGVSICGAALLSATWPGSALLAATWLVPLLLPLRGLLRGDRRTHAWATLCVAPYIVYGITESVANAAVRGVAALILLASLAHFVSLVAYLRLSRPQPSGQAGPMP
jgi:uncharacterized membrane protein